MTHTTSPAGQSGRACRIATLCLVAASLFIVTTAYAQFEADPAGNAKVAEAALRHHAHGPVLVVPLKPEVGTLYHDGSEIVVEREERWQFMCGSEMDGLTVADLEWVAERNRLAFESGPAVIVDSGTRTGGINIVFNADSSVPADALTALAQAEAYIESVFGDDITVTIACRFDSLPSGVLGATSSSYRSNESWNNSRDGLQNGMDADDVIQSWLPSGSTIPVRYNASSSTVTDENRVDWTVANWNSTIGTLGGGAGSMTFSTSISWDYNPNNGVAWNRMSFVDVVVHETGHALGFVSAVDSGEDKMDAMDIFRFQRNDDDGDYNPDTYEELSLIHI